MSDDGPGRAFAVSAGGEASELVGSNARIEHMGFSPGVVAGVDVLDDASLLTEDRAKLIVAAERNGDDPERFARHLVKLCRVAQS